MTDTIPTTWETKTLGEAVEVLNGFAFPSEDFVDRGLPIIRISNIKDGVVDLSKAVYFVESENLDNFAVNHGDILIAMSGATTGKSR